MIKLHDNKYLIRTPLLPLHFAEICFECVDNVVFNNDDFLYGLYHSSPDLYNEYQKAKQNITDEKLLHSLQKYYVRACSRSTPYANFAGSSLGEFGKNTSIQLKDTADHNPTIRLDMGMMFAIIEMLEKDDNVINQLKYRSNNSLYKFNEKYRYVRHETDEKRTYYLTEAEATPYLDDVLELCKNGNTIETLCASLIKYGVTNHEAIEYVKQLIKSHILISELDPYLSGTDNLEMIINIISKMDNTDKYVILLTNIRKIIRDRHTHVHEFQELRKNIESAGLSSEIKTPFQCDIYKTTTSNTISQKAIENLLEKINELLYLVPLSISTNNNIDNFKRNFRAAYEQQIIPLAEVLDVENGIGYGNSSPALSPLLNGIDFDDNNKSDKQTDTQFNALLQKRMAVQSTINYNPIHLKKNDFDFSQYNQNKAQINLSARQNMFIMGSLLANSAEGVDKNEYQFLFKLLSGVSFGNLLTRFFHIDNNLETWIKDLAENEAAQLDDNVVYAEIIHLPQERLANISIRPIMRSYEITYLGRSGMPLENQIPISDLLVTVENNLIILYSKKLRKRVIPRLTNAHNYRNNSLPVYHFLCDLQNQQSFSGISWENLYKHSGSFSPRISYENIILKRAIWTITSADVKEALEGNTDTLDLFKQIQVLRKIPNKVVILQGDNELLIFLNKLDSIKILLNYVKKYKSVQIAEFLFEDNCFIKDSVGKYSHEILFPVKIDSTNKLSLKKHLSQDYEAIKRMYLPGDNWLYYKFYCNENTGESLLSDKLYFICDSLEKEGVIERYFFVRYADPQYHIRLRLRLRDNNSILIISNRINTELSHFLKNRTIKNLQIDTYIRELERYTHLIDACEDIFCHDSKAVLRILRKISEDADDSSRWKLALLGVDALLNDFQLNINEKKEYISVYHKGYFNEFGASSGLEHQLNDKYRALKNDIFSIFKQNNDELTTYVEFFNTRSNDIKPLIDTMSFKSIDRKSLIAHLLHMFLNRLFITDNRKQELVTYHLLSKYYTAIIAINKKSMSNDKSMSL